MDFTFTTEQDDAAALAAQILADKTTNDRLKEVERGGDRFDRDLWRELGSAGLLSLAVPEAYGGAGLGLIELCRVLVEVGRTVAPVPLAVHGTAALVLAEHGTDEQKDRWLPGAATGEHVLTAAVAEERVQLPSRPTVTASPKDGSWSLSGSKAIVRAGQGLGCSWSPRRPPMGWGSSSSSRPVRAWSLWPSAPATATPWPGWTWTEHRPSPWAQPTAPTIGRVPPAWGSFSW